MRSNKNKGFVITYVLLFGVVFLILLSGLLSFILSQLRQSKHELAYEQALHIAEAGLERYRWYLIHKSQALFDGAEIGCPPSNCLDCLVCEYELTFPGLGKIGKYRLEIEEERACGVTTAIRVMATGWTTEFPDIQRKISVHYVRPTVAEYSYILNDNVWAGADRTIMGPYHSNGGIRMDGQNNSLVTSAQDEWICTASYGCSVCPLVCQIQAGGECLCPGVFTTANGRVDLFRTGISRFDFEGIIIELGRVKSLTQPFPEGMGKGLYLPPSGKKGYHVILKGREVEVRKIKELTRVMAHGTEKGWHWEYSIISEKGSAINYSLDDCGLIFIEDDVWLEGEVEGKITLVVADLITHGKERNVWLKDDIIYRDGGKPDGFILMSQGNILITPDSPDYLDLQGVFIAQTGFFGRNHYPHTWYPNYARKEKLRIFGTIVSNGRVGTKWSSGGAWVSGYRQRETIFNPILTFNPPPFIPSTSEEFRFKGWEEKR